MNNSGRIFKDSEVNKKEEHEPKNLAEIAAKYNLIDDLAKKEQPLELTRMQRKFQRIFGAAGNTSTLFLQGFKMGAMVGCGFGGVLGAWQAYAIRDWKAIPLSMIISGGSFGFFMGIGMTLRVGGM